MRSCSISLFEARYRTRLTPNRRGTEHYEINQKTSYCDNPVERIVIRVLVIT